MRTSKFTIGIFTILSFAILSAEGGCRWMGKHCKCSPYSVQCENVNASELLNKITPDLFPNLQTLEVTNGNIPELNADIFGSASIKHEHLRSISIRNCTVRSIDPHAFSQAPYLTHLDLSGNPISRELSSSVKTAGSTFLGQIHALFHLNLSNITSSKGYRLDKISLEYLLKQPNMLHIRELDLSSNRLRRFPTKDLCRMEKLQVLNLSYNKLKNLDLHLNCTNALHTIDLTFNKVRTLRVYAQSQVQSKFQNSASDQMRPPPTIDLRGSRLKCDCRLKGLLQWAKTTGHLRNQREVKCARPKHLSRFALIDLKPEQLECIPGAASSFVSPVAVATMIVLQTLKFISID